MERFPNLGAIPSGAELTPNNETEQESLEQVVEDISIENLSESDLREMTRFRQLKETLLGGTYESSIVIKKEIEDFIEELHRGYTDDQLRQCALYFILIDEELPSGVEYLDTEGEYSIAEFLSSLSAKVNS